MNNDPFIRDFVTLNKSVINYLPRCSYHLLYNKTPIHHHQCTNAMHQHHAPPMHGSASSSTNPPIRPHLTHTKRDYMILLLFKSPLYISCGPTCRWRMEMEMKMEMDSKVVTARSIRRWWRWRWRWRWTARSWPHGHSEDDGDEDGDGDGPVRSRRMHGLINISGFSNALFWW